MVMYFKDFLLNIFMIFSPLTFYAYVHKTYSKPRLFQFLLYVLFAIALVTTMLFPISVDGLIYDFRSIPIVVGSLYGGPLVSLFLFVTLVIHRYLLDNPSNLLYACALIPSFLMIFFTTRKYRFFKVYQKIAASIILCTLMKVLTFTLYFAFLGRLPLLGQNLLESMSTYVTQAVMIGVYVYLIEFLNKYHHLQDEVYRSEKIKLVSEMAASVAHEIRNPLTTVRGFIQLLGSAQVDREKTEYYQRICLEELSRAEMIINDYLSIAKPDPEKIEPILLNDEIGYLTNVLMTYAHYNNIRIQAMPSEDQDMCIVGDRHKFRQALINIGKNAIEAMPDGGTVEIKAMKWNENVALRISDTGIGMTPEQVKRLGTPYYSTKDKGTGLGTMVSFVIIRKMNGKIDVKSKPGKGTEYTFVFPIVQRGSALSD